MTDVTSARLARVDTALARQLSESIQRNSRLANETWNAAIEAAAERAATAIGVGTLLATHTTMEIRKLKK